MKSTHANAVRPAALRPLRHHWSLHQQQGAPVQSMFLLYPSLSSFARSGYQLPHRHSLHSCSRRVLEPPQAVATVAAVAGQVLFATFAVAAHATGLSSTTPPDLRVRMRSKSGDGWHAGREPHCGGLRRVEADTKMPVIDYAYRG